MDNACTVLEIVGHGRGKIWEMIPLYTVSQLWGMSGLLGREAMQKKTYYNIILDNFFT